MKRERKYNKFINPDLVHGAVLAAEVAYDLQGKSEYRLDDRILLKLNIINKRQVRKDKKEGKDG